MKNLIISVLGAVVTTQLNIWEVRPKGMFLLIQWIWMLITYSVDFKW